jgi:sugar phosphate isomerase/epimerase
MMTRRDFFRTSVAGLITGEAQNSILLGDDRPAWPGPIGLQIYTVRQLYAQNPLGTLKEVAAAGYKQVELAGSGPPHLTPTAIKSYLRQTGLKAIGAHYPLPKTSDDWKPWVEQAHALGLQYTGTNNTAHTTADEWKQLAALFNECGRISKPAGIQFTYHNHIREFERHGTTDGYEILLSECDPTLVKMEMDIFWVTYAGQNSLLYFRLFPGRFPLLHIKDMKKGITVNPDAFPSPGSNPFAPVGQGRIDWPRIFAHVNQAGAKHIFVEQDRCDGSPLAAIRTSYRYLRNLRVA